jgi:hypothetical protein
VAQGTSGNRFERDQQGHAVITWELEEDIGVLRLGRPPMNALNLELLR